MRRARLRRAGLTLVVLTAAFVPGQAVAARVRVPEAPPGYVSPEPYGVSLVPEAATGSFGWQIAYEAFGAREYGEHYLPEDPAAAAPILFDAGLGGMLGGPSSRFDRRIVITTGAVASVSVDHGPLIPTVPAVGLPLELRSALYDIPGVSPGQIARGVMGTRIRAFDSNGQQVLYTPPPPVPSKPAPAPVLETRTWQLPAPAALGVCDIWPDSRRGVSGLTESSGSVVSKLRAVTGLTNRPLISCANTQFSHQELSLESFMLLDLEHPGVAPAPIPGMTPLVGRPGVYQALLRGEALVARRVPGAWLLVRGGSDLHQRLRLLTHLRATVRLKPRRGHALTPRRRR